MCRGSGPWWLGICAAALGAGILVGALFPTGFALLIAAALLMACGWLCCREN